LKVCHLRKKGKVGPSEKDLLFQNKKRPQKKRERHSKEINHPKLIGPKRKYQKRPHQRADRRCVKKNKNETASSKNAEPSWGRSVSGGDGYQRRKALLSDTKRGLGVSGGGSYFNEKKSLKT